MKEMKKKKRIGDGYCHECQLKRGAEIPRGGLLGVTVTDGICGSCNQKASLVPSSDYNWPKKGLKAVWD